MLVAGLWLVLPLGSFGVWDPHEVETADLARRVAVHAFGAEHLARPGDPASIPTSSDLGSGELGVTSIALSFSLFGVSDVAGRLPLALWGLAGVMSLHLLLSRTLGRRAGVFGALALLALPVFQLQARTMLGDVVPMSAMAIATAGAASLVIERGRAWTIASSALLAIGLASGFLSRGLSVCVVPLLAAGAASWSSGVQLRRARGLLVAGIALALLTAVMFVLHDTDPVTRRVIGMTLVDPEPATSTFDRMFRHLGHGLFPLSALLPVAVARLTRGVAQRAAPGAPSDRAAVGRVVLFAGALAALTASIAVTPFAGALPFFGVVFVAGLLGALAASLRVEPMSRGGVLATLMLLFVLRTDMQRVPDRMLESFAMGTMEPSHVAAGLARLVDVAALALVALLVLSMRSLPSLDVEENPAAAEQNSAPNYFAAKLEELRERMRALVGVSDGNVVFAFVLFEAALVGMAIMLAVGSRLGWQALTSLPDAFGRFGVAVWWALPLACASLYAAWVLTRDAASWMRRTLRVTGSTWVGAGFAVSGGVLAFGYFPAFFDNASPRHALQRYEGTRAEGDALGVFGASPALAPFYVSEPVTPFTDLQRAFMFLDKSELSGGRHFLALRRDELPMLNQLWRLEHRKNVPVVDAASDVLLVASSAEPSESPLDRIVLDEAPSFAHPVSAIFDESVEITAWQLESASGKQVDVLLTGQPYTLRVALEVKRRPDEEWMAFVHIEKKGLRSNGDHTPLGGAYPMRLWLPRDVVVDEHVFTLPPNFTPDRYRILFGFFMGGERIPVTEGPARDNRVELGTVEVR